MFCDNPGYSTQNPRASLELEGTLEVTESNLCSKEGFSFLLYNGLELLFEFCHYLKGQLCFVELISTKSLIANFRQLITSILSGAKQCNSTFLYMAV